MKTLVHISTFFLTLTAPLTAGEAAKPDWPQWRGPKRDSQVAGPTWPDSLKDDVLQQLWRVPLGPGYPGPIVTADRVFVAETKDKKQEVVRALDRSTGKQVWEASWEGALSVPFFARANGDWIRSTPAFDGDSLYVAGMRDVLVCLDARTGKQRWRFDFVQEMKTPLPSFGMVCSPLVEGENVYVQAGAALAKLAKNTGKPAWTSLKDTGSMMDSAFSSPVLATIQGKKQLVAQTRTTLAGVDPDNGAVLWSEKVPAFRNMNILTPMVFEDKVFTSTYGGKSFCYQIKNADGKLSAAEAWSNRQQGYMSSPVIIGGHLYLHLRNQRFTCIDLKDGKEKWISGETYGQYWSMIAQGDKILALDDRGILFLIQANPEKLDILDQRKISKDSTWGHLAISGDEIFVRELNAVTAYRWREKK